MFIPISAVLFLQRLFFDGLGLGLGTLVLTTRLKFCHTAVMSVDSVRRTESGRCRLST